METFPTSNKRRAFNIAVGPGKSTKLINLASFRHYLLTILEALGATSSKPALLQRLLKSDQKFCLAFLLSKRRLLLCAREQRSVALGITGLP